MTEIQESWKEVAGKAEALGLKLKLHLEQESDESTPRAPGDTKAMVDEFTQKMTDAFDSMGNAAKDTAVHEDVKDMGRLFRDALVTTFNSVGAEITNRTGANTPPPPTGDSPQDAVAEIDDSSGDESGDGDS